MINCGDYSQSELSSFQMDFNGQYYNALSQFQVLSLEERTGVMGRVEKIWFRKF